MTNIECIKKKKERHHFINKFHIVKVMVFPVVIYRYESWTLKKAECRRLDAFELWCWRRLLRVPWTAGRSNQSILQETNPGIFIGRTDAKAPILWSPNAKSQLIGKYLDAEKNWGQEEKGMTGDEMVGWHHWLDGQEFEQALGDSEGQGSLECSSPWGRKELDVTEQLNNKCAQLKPGRGEWISNSFFCPKYPLTPSKSPRLTANCHGGWTVLL